MDEFSDVLYEVDNGLATITINRPDRFNAFRAQTVDELVLSFKRAWASDEVGVHEPSPLGAGGDQGSGLVVHPAHGEATEPVGVHGGGLGVQPTGRRR